MMRKCTEDCKMFNKYLVISYNKQRNIETNAVEFATNSLQHSHFVLGHCEQVSLPHPAHHGEPLCLSLSREILT